MKEQILRELAVEYESQRAANRDEEQRRLAEASALDPMIGALTERRLELFLQRVRAAFDSPERAMEISKELGRELAAISSELRKRLKAVGLPEDRLQPVYRCAVCRDQGYIGEPIREMCDCLKQRVYQRLCRDDNLGVQTDENFAAWNEMVFDPTPTEQLPQGQRAEMLRHRAACESYADSFPQTEKPNLLFLGPSGVGKTYMLNCVAQRVLERGYTPWKLTASQMMAILRDAYFDRGDPERARLLRESPLLMIDDLGTEPMQENLTVTQLFSLLNERGARRQHTIVSTNLTPKELALRYTERVFSRLFDKRLTRVLQFRGADARMLRA
ncbi:MAG: ATP-binding protein [Oscillospiraceae bacterium]|jgi:DNA replication protein DnaC|nr:ATP-binding protein [Oscillospiraceae bacterium]